MAEVDKISLEGIDSGKNEISQTPKNELSKPELLENPVNKKVKRTKAEYLQELADKKRLKEQEVAEKRRIREKELEERRRLKEAELEEKKKARERELEDKKKQKEKELEEKRKAREREIEERKKFKEQELEEKRKQKELELEERRKLKNQKEQERLEKEKIKQQKDEENLSKLRISNFFKKKNDRQDNIENRNTKPGTFSRPITLNAVTDDSLIEGENLTNITINDSSIVQIDEDTICDFDKEFQDFYLKTNYERFGDNTNKKSRSVEIDSIINSQEDFTQTLKDSFVSLKNLKAEYLSKQVLITLQDNSLVVFHECDRGDMSDTELLKLLEKVPHKYLKFYENVSLPFTGTYSESTLIPANNPFDVEKTDFEYSKDSDYEAVAYIDSDVDGDNEFDDGEEGEELDSEDDDEDEDDDYDDSGNELDEFVEPDATGVSSKDTVAKNSKKKTLLIPTIQFNNKEAAVFLDPLQQSFFNDNDREYIDSISATILYPTPININEPIGLPEEKEVEPKKRTLEKAQTESTDIILKDGESENTENSTALSNEIKTSKEEPDPKRAKIIISDTKALIKMLKKVSGCPYSKNTMVEVIGFDLESKFSRKIIKDTVDHYATRVKDIWAMNDPDIIKKLEEKIISDSSNQ